MADNIALEVFLVMGSNVTMTCKIFGKCLGKVTHDSPACHAKERGCSVRGRLITLSKRNP